MSETVLKQALIDSGYNPDEIKKIIERIRREAESVSK